MVEGEEEWLVDRILDERMQGRGHQYLVHWKWLGCERRQVVTRQGIGWDRGTRCLVTSFEGVIQFFRVGESVIIKSLLQIPITVLGHVFVCFQPLQWSGPSFLFCIIIFFFLQSQQVPVVLCLPLFSVLIYDWFHRTTLNQLLKQCQPLAELMREVGARPP